MTADNHAVDVLIVGAGPVGLFLACECARRGLRFRIVERHATQSQHSKALAIFPRTMECFDMAGIAAPFLAAANRVTALALGTPRRRLAHIDFAPQGTAYPFIAMVPQDVTERLLVEALQRVGAEVEYQTALTGFEPHAGGVTATLERDGVREAVTATYMVGCDGAHSTVRQCLDLDFAGAAYPEHFMLADVETNAAFPASELQLCPHRDGPLAVFPMSASRCRIVAMVRQPEGEAPTLDMVARLLTERAPAGIAATSLHWSGYFQIHHRRVACLRKGRVFVAGDAAHIHSPFGGQGMNTGLQDAWNLAWKLDLCLHGHGNEALLDSYSAERIPVIAGVIATTDFLTRTLGTPSRVANALRNALIPVLSRLAPVRRRLVQKLSELAISCAGSPIVEGAGERFVDPSLGAGGICSRFVLFLDEAAPAAVLDDARRLVEAHAAVLELRRYHARGISLVRPDGYVAMSAQAASAASMAAAGRLLERQAGRG